MILSWLGPSLARRLFVALFLAFVLIEIGLTANDFFGYKKDEANIEGLEALTQTLRERLAQIPTADAAVLFIRSTEGLVNDVRRQPDHPMGDCLWQIFDAQGKLLYATKGQTTNPLPVQKGRKILARINGKLFFVSAIDAGPWHVRLAKPKLNDKTVLGWISIEMIPSLLLAFPLVLLPVWFGISRGLRPLRQLKEHLARRDPDDLSPLGIDMRYPELAQVTIAFDGVLAKLRRKVERERAFVQDAAHELRTPMAVISAQAHVLARANDPDDRRQAEAALDNAIARASHLTQQLLALAALDHAAAKDKQLVDVAALLQQMLAQLAPAAIASQVDLSLDAPERLVLSIELPSLQSIIQNLLDNAFKYGRDGGHIEVRLSEHKAWIEFEVADDGPGIAPEDRPRVFERFYRGKGHDAPGTGLGLAICHEAVLALGGSLSLKEGLNGKGASFVVRLPRPSGPASTLAR